jgi:hypothetical protein
LSVVLDGEDEDGVAKVVEADAVVSGAEAELGGAIDQRRASCWRI